MRFARPAVAPWGVLLWVAATQLGCGARAIPIIGTIPDGGEPPTPCPSTLAARLSVTDILVDKDIAWQKSGYDQFPADERVALAVQPNGQALIAWTEVNPTKAADGSQQLPMGVHVTPLDANFARRGADAILSTAQEVSGLVAHDDGFALLTRDLNPGTKIDLGDGATVAFLVRYQNGQQSYRVPLTGSASGDAAETFTLYSPFLEGQLAWDGTAYGAYFVVEGGQGDSRQGYWRDALVFRDAFLGPAPWTVAHGCENNGGLRLINDSGKVNLVGATWANIPAMTGLCIQQSRESVKLTAMEADRLVSDQEVQWSGYSGARMGSLLKIPGGYLVFWLSLGASIDQNGHDIRMARLDSNFQLVSGPNWLLPRTPGREEWNLHVVPYGPTQFLMVYGEIANINSPLGDDAVYLGDYVGTHLALIDLDGNVIADEIVNNAATTANAEPVVLPNGDVAWPFVNPSPDYTQRIYGVNGPGQTALHVAHLRYCK